MVDIRNFDRNLDSASTQAMQNKIKHLQEKVDYLENGNRRLHDSYEARNQGLQDKLDTCENRNEALFGRQSNNQVCERKIKGIGQMFFRSSGNINLKIIYKLWFHSDKN